MRQQENILSRFFKLKENKTTVKTEILAGITTFITLAYAILVIPNILKGAGMNSAGALGEGANAFTVLNDPVVGAIFTSTCLMFTVATLFMGLYANLPYVLGPGMGLVAFFTYGVCLTMGFTWQQAAAAVFMSGVLFILCTVTSLRQTIVRALPHNIKMAITSGIGLFIALIGMKTGGIITANPSTLVQFGNFTEPGTLLTIIGVVITLGLMVRNVKGAMLIGIVTTTLIGIPMGITNVEGVQIFSMPPSPAPTFMQLDFAGLFGIGGGGIIGVISTVVMVILTFSLVDMFDSIGTFVGISEKVGLKEADGSPKGMNKALLVDSFATTFSALFSLPTVSTYIESASGITQGGRTGLTAVTVAVLTALTMFFSGLVGVIPGQATAPALIVVGILMMQTITQVDFSSFDEAVPAFFTIAIMPFSYSIANGIACGIIMYPLMKLATGKRKEVHPLVYVLAVLFVLRYIVVPQ
ncbi:MAG: NCS2 family permease [Cellulosilyticaceae bacterium]